MAGPPEISGASIGEAPPPVKAPKPQAKRPVQKAAAQRVQRYYNRGTGRMEALVHGHFPSAPAPHPPAGHTVSSTTHTVRRESAPVPTRQPPSLIQMTPAQIEDRAKRIVNSELAAERLPFQQRAAQLPGEEQGVLQAHNANYGGLGAGVNALQAQAAASAKTYQNEAADAVKRAEGPTPGSAEANEHLGGAPAPGSSLARQQEAARTLLTSIASGAQAGTNARQQSESNFLTSLAGTVGMESAAGVRQIQGDYGRKKETLANEEAKVSATKPGRVGRLAGSMMGEQEKLRIAAQGLNIKGAEAERHAEETRSTIRTRNQKAGLEGKKYGLAVQKQKADEAYKRASAPDKKRKDELDTKKKELEIKKALEGNPHGTLTADKVNELSGEAAKVFNIFQRAREKNLPPPKIREAITRGYFRWTPNKQQEEEKKKPYNEKTGIDLKQPIWLDVAEQIMQKEYVDAPTKQRLREMGLPDSGWSNHFLAGRTKPPASPGARSLQKLTPKQARELQRKLKK